MRHKLIFITSTCLVSLALSACGDAVGSGSVRLTTYGEDFIEKQIPAAGSGGEGLVDGYTVSYSKFLVVLSGLKVADASGAVAAELSEPLVFDLHRAGPHTITTLSELEAKRWDRVEATIRPITSAKAGNATAADVARMTGDGLSVYVEGKGEKPGKTIVFSWGFKTATRYSECQEKSTGSGVAVPSGGTATVQFTIHGDHLFYDDLQSSDPSLRFAAVAAADADGDGRVTLAELEKVDLTTLPSGQYGTGGAGSVKTLGQFIAALSRTLLHYQGEGHCHSSAPK